MRTTSMCFLVLLSSACMGEAVDDDVGEEARESRAALDDSTTIAGGDRHTCALRHDGTVRCAGNNAHGQLGNGTVVNSLGPVAVLGLSGATAITAGHDHSCALVADGRIMCWG